MHASKQARRRRVSRMQHTRAPGAHPGRRLTLRVRQVVPLVGVQREAQAALVLPQVVAHEVRVLAQVDRLQCQPPQPLAPVHSLPSGGAERERGKRRRAVRAGRCPEGREGNSLLHAPPAIHAPTSCCADTKPLPGLEPAGGSRRAAGGERWRRRRQVAGPSAHGGRRAAHFIHSRQRAAHRSQCPRRLLAPQSPPPRSPCSRASRNDMVKRALRPWGAYGGYRAAGEAGGAASGRVSPEAAAAASDNCAFGVLRRDRARRLIVHFCAVLRCTLLQKGRSSPSEAIAGQCKRRPTSSSGARL